MNGTKAAPKTHGRWMLVRPQQYLVPLSYFTLFMLYATSSVMVLNLPINKLSEYQSTIVQSLTTMICDENKRKFGHFLASINRCLNMCFVFTFSLEFGNLRQIHAWVKNFWFLVWMWTLLCKCLCYRCGDSLTFIPWMNWRRWTNRVTEIYLSL